MFIQEEFVYKCPISDSDFEYSHQKFAIQNEANISHDTHIQFNVTKLAEGWYLTSGPPEVNFK